MKNIKSFEQLNEKKTELTFTKSDLEKCWRASSSTSFDTGIKLYRNFEEWYKILIKNKK